MQSGTRNVILLVYWSFSTCACTCQSLSLQSLSSEGRGDAPTCLQAEVEDESSVGKLLIQRSTRSAAVHLNSKFLEDHPNTSMPSLNGNNQATILPHSVFAQEVSLLHNTNQADYEWGMARLDRNMKGWKHDSRTQSVIAGVMAVMMSIVVVVLVLVWSSPCQKDPQACQSLHLDNAQVLAQFLVIYSNLCYSNVLPFWGEPKTGATDWQSWLFNANNLLMSLGDAFNTVCLPMMCFVVGVCSKGPTTEVRLRRFIENLVLPTLIWVLFAKPIIYDTMMEGNLEGFTARVANACQLNTFHQEWWLQCLVLWQASTFVLWSHLRPSLAFAMMMTLSAIAGYLNLNGPLWFLRLDDVFGFLPYFGFGYLFPFDAASKYTARLHVPIITSIGLVVLWVFAIIPLAGALPSSQGNYECCTAGGIFKELQALNSKGYKFYWARRLVRFALDMPPVLLLMFCVVPRKLTPVSWIGQHYLHPYLFHSLANHWRSELVRCVAPPVVTSMAGHIAVLVFHLPYVIGSMFVFASQPWRVLFAWCFEPTWLKATLTSRNEGKHNQVSKPLARDILKQSPSNEKAERKSMTPPSEESQAGISTRFPSDRDTQRSSYSSPRSTDEAAELNPESMPEAVHKPKVWQSTGCELLWQEPSRKYYGRLWCAWLGSAIFACIAIAMARPGAHLALKVANKVPLWLPLSAHIMALVFAPSNYVYHYFRLRGTDQLPEPTNAPPLQHAIVIVAYKEPLEVLMRTVRTIIAQRGIGVKPMIVFASEDRDPTAQESFQALSREVADNVDLFLMTKHQITEGETVGKSSNENYAVQQLYQLLVEEQGRDPFEIMLTIVDADSLISDTYLAQCEASFRKQCDGRRLIYSGPLNVYRNFAQANLFVQAYEINRCHGDVFHNPLVQYNPQSNYSITLGFAHELEFWTPDLMPEDIHTANRAMISNFGSQTCVAIPSFICNDLVTDFGDRYTQALRHQFGSVTEFAWGLAMWFDNPKMSFPLWWSMMRRECGRDGSFLCVGMDTVTFVFSWAIMLWLYSNWTQLTWKCQFYACLVLSLRIWKGFWFWAAECTLWQTLLKQFPIQQISAGRWCLLILLYPFLLFVGDVLFYMGATIHSLVRITTIGELTYVAAPKGDAPKAPKDDAKQSAGQEPEIIKDQKP